ncbi:MAG: iron ABC transporter permease [Weeksellaceae bacterium]|nr:iron ABC transporter permease [Weeksellaceae bacterium]
MSHPAKDSYSIYVLLLAIFVFLILGMIPQAYTDYFLYGKGMLPDTNTAWHIATQYKLPRMLSAIFAGITLPLSGWLLQEFFRNPIAGPSVLGITTFSGLGTAVVLMLGSSIAWIQWVPSRWLVMSGAIVGAFLAMLILLFVAQKMKSTVMLIIFGFMLSALAGSLIALMEFFANARQLQNFVIWGFGSLDHLSYQLLGVYFLVLIPAILWIIFLVPRMQKMLLGELYAQTMGVNIKKIRWEIVFITSLLAGLCTALVGPIAFIGLAVPHFVRIRLKTANFKKLMLHIILYGVLFMLCNAWLAQMAPGGMLPINIIASLIGAPVVMYIIFQSRQTLY